MHSVDVPCFSSSGREMELGVRYAIQADGELSAGGGSLSLPFSASLTSELQSFSFQNSRWLPPVSTIHAKTSVRIIYMGNRLRGME